MRHAIWWHLYPLGFTGAPPTMDPGAPPAHRLGRVEAWLDHARSLGANGIQLGPVFRSATHGYDTLDHFRVDPRLGDQADFSHLVDQCHRRGMRVMCDGVFNHISRDHPLARRARCEGPDSDAGRMIAWDAGASGGPRPRVFEGHDILVELDHSSPAVVDLVARVMEHWCSLGVDAWRMDAAYAVPPSFWARVLQRVRGRFPRVLAIGEVIHGDYAAIVEESTLDSVTQYELWKAIWSSIESRNLFELDWAFQRHNAFLGSFVPTTFVGNHDVTRIASRVGGEGAAVAAAILLASGGMPVIYAGDELAMTGVKEDRPGGDDAVRPEFPDRPAAMPPDAQGARMMRRYQDMVGLRRRHPWLVRAATVSRELANEHAVWEVSGPGEGQRLLLEVDLGGPEPRARVRDAGGVLFDTAR
jgi:glycosidase